VLERKGSAMLVVGAPGAGKSTLSVALDRRDDFVLHGDDIAALEPDGTVRAIPLPATLKAGAWPLLAAHRPDLAALPVYRRPDGQFVRYLQLMSHPARSSLRVACVLSLAGDADAAPALETLDPGDGFATLLNGAWTESERLSIADFDAVAACVAGARLFRLRSRDLHDALPLVREAWGRSTAA
jgi:hypothetical protein